MSMQDFASALQGAPPPGALPPGGPAPDAGGGLPPDLGGGGLPPDIGGLPPGGPPPDGPAPDGSLPGTSDTFSNSLEALDAAEQALQAFIQLDPDHADKAVAAQCLQNVLKLKASNADSAQAGDLKSLQRALQGGPGAVAGPVGQAAAGGGY